MLVTSSVWETLMSLSELGLCHVEQNLLPAYPPATPPCKPDLFLQEKLGEFSCDFRAPPRQMVW